MIQHAPISLTRLLTLLIILIPGLKCFSADWQPAKGPLTTRWAKNVSPENVHPEYPRPQMVRENWTNLNGLWEYAIRPAEEERPQQFDGEILVPFAIESALSGVMKKVGPRNRLWYRRSFNTPQLTGGQRLLLNFGAVDWQSVVWVNGQRVGEHTGGYDPFSLDITEALKPDAANQEIVVAVWDPSDAGFQPRGKQVREPRGIWYTSVTGIWQTVWMETVPEARIESLKVTPDVDNGAVSVTVNVSVPRGNGKLQVAVYDGETKIYESTGPLNGLKERIRLPVKKTLPVKDAKLWSPESPFLYDLKVSLEWGQEPADSITSYFGMRKIELKRGEDGFNRLFLNGKPRFMYGPLDQGWWPDGLYTAPSDEALKYDIEVTRKLGMNMCRKHVKVEPARWYYWCDKLGLLVWQDMPNGDRHIGRDDPDINRSAQSERNFRLEYKALIDSHYNHPCIVVWVPFNEGWGQFKTDEILAWTKQYDPTRLVDGPSGWTDRGTGDINDMHRYPGPAMPEPEEKRAVVLGEFGGLGWPVEGHLWWNKRNWGYRTYKTREELQQNYDKLMEQLHPLIGRGLAGAIYTQTTDVEGEVNGLMTYDRSMIKLDVEKVAKTHAGFYESQAETRKQSQLSIPAQRPHIVMYLSDDHGQEFAGCYGNKVIRTPHIDALAKQGMRFTGMFAASPTCAPSRSVLYTGLYPARNGAMGNHTVCGPDVKSLPTYLKKLGYRVVLANKTHVGPKEVFDFEYLPATLPRNPDQPRRYRREGLDTAAIDSFLADHAERNPRQPLCLILADDNPHVTWETNKVYDPAELPIPPNMVDTEITRTALANYYQEITTLDRRIGEVRDSLKKHGYAQNTLFLYTSDQGPEWPHCKWTVYDSGLRVPFVAVWPGKISPGSVCDALISFVDVTPTFIELGGGEAPQNLDGRSFRNVLFGEKKTFRKFVFASHTGDGKMNVFPQRGARSRQYKYVLNLQPENTWTTHFTKVPGIPNSHKAVWDTWIDKARVDKTAARLVEVIQHHPEEELYDTQQDPYELNNLASRPEMQETLADLRAELKTWMDSTGDGGLKTEARNETRQKARREARKKTAQNK